MSILLRKFLLGLSLVLMLALLSACGGSDSSSNVSSTQPTTGTDSGGDTGNDNGGNTGNESVSLAWVAPTTRADGTFLLASELAGYRIYMGSTRDDLAPIVDLVNDNTNEYLVRNLATGDYYFAITAYDSSGIESYYSEVIVITI